MAPHFDPQNLRSRQAGDWRGARHLVIEGEARVIARRTGASTRHGAAAFEHILEPTEPVWGAALRAADRLRAGRRAAPRAVLPAGAALLGLAILGLVLVPGEPDPSSPGELPARLAAAPSGTLR